MVIEMDYIFCARGKRGDGFGNEPAACQFLRIPDSDTEPKPSHKIKKSEWVKDVMEEAKGGTPNPLTSGDILFYVHGFNNSPKTVLERHRKIKAGLEAHGYQGAVISFDWPSADSALNYLEDRTDAKLTAFRLVSDGIAAFATLQEPDCRVDLHILAHSMGSYVVREAFDDADDRARIAGRNWSVGQVMLMGGDVSVGSLEPDNPKSSSLYRHCARLTNYYNPHDDTLSISAVKRVGVAPRAGRVGLTKPFHPKAANVYCGLRYKSQPHQDGLNAGHVWYFDDSYFLLDVFHNISGQLDRHEFPTRSVTDRGNLSLLSGV